MPDDLWKKNLTQICYRYDLHLENLAEVLNDPKVIPMIRGKAFEFFAKNYISNILPRNYKVRTPKMNAQSNEHDVDIEIVDPGNKKNRIECKLSAKGHCQVSDQGVEIKVKCMQSRTKGAKVVASLAPKLGVSENQLTIHNDQYRQNDFDFVLTTIGNSFYKTDSDGLYYFSPEPKQNIFLKTLNACEQSEAYSKLYIAKSSELVIRPENKVICTRRKCDDKYNCNFIPNYPIIYFKKGKTIPEHPWFPIDEVRRLIDE